MPNRGGKIFVKTWKTKSREMQEKFLPSYFPFSEGRVNQDPLSYASTPYTGSMVRLWADICLFILEGNSSMAAHCCPEMSSLPRIFMRLSKHSSYSLNWVGDEGARQRSQPNEGKVEQKKEKKKITVDQFTKMSTST